MLKLLQAAAKSTLAAICVTSLLLACAAAQTPKPDQLAQQSCDTWLVLVDAGKYADSWTQASQMFKSAVTQQQWQAALEKVRTPLGKVVSRKFRNAQYTNTLPGAPDGEYVVVQYDTTFEHKESATETLAPMLEKDGTWKISGYFIK